MHAFFCALLDSASGHSLGLSIPSWLGPPVEGRTCSSHSVLYPLHTSCIATVAHAEMNQNIATYSPEEQTVHHNWEKHWLSEMLMHTSPWHSDKRAWLFSRYMLPALENSTTCYKTWNLKLSALSRPRFTHLRSGDKNPLCSPWLL